MKFSKLAGLGAVTLNAASTVAQSSYCAEDASDVCFAWGVPEAGISSGSGNVYFQITAPTSYTWTALGIGSGMSGSDMFVMYQDGAGNVTLSTRAGTGHRMPEYTRTQGVELLAGSGVQDGNMVANVRCSSCSRLDLEGTNSWIAAWMEGDALDSSSPDARIGYHNGRTVFQVDMTHAEISSDSNPFVQSDPGSGNGNSPPFFGGDGDGGGGDGGNGAGSGIVETGGFENARTLLRAHGIIMTIVFVVGYPLGAILIPLVPFWYVHALVQMVVFLAMWAGFGIGYALAEDIGRWWNNTHTKLGTIVVALLALQPVLGYAHHLLYKKYKSRTAVSYMHIWYGRALMVCGVVNGGLGLELSGASNGYVIVYSAVAAFMGFLYIVASGFGSYRRRKKAHREKVRSPVRSRR